MRVSYSLQTCSVSRPDHRYRITDEAVCELNITQKLVCSGTLHYYSSKSDAPIAACRINHTTYSTLSAFHPRPVHLQALSVRSACRWSVLRRRRTDVEHRVLGVIREAPGGARKKRTHDPGKYTVQ